MTASIRVSSIALLTLASGFCACAAPNVFSSIPKEADPAKIGKRVAGNFLERKFRAETDPKKKANGIIYPEACAWYGSLQVARFTGDKELQDKLVHKFDPLMSEPGSALINQTAHVDYRVFGIVPLELYTVTKDQKYLDIGQKLADAQWENPTPDGITREARYWIDDMYMIPAVQVQAFRATGDTKYLDRSAKTVVAYLERLQQTNGLFYHGTNAPFYWGRGNGWMAAGFAELLHSLPKDHPQRPAIVKGAQQMMATLLKHQSGSGIWRQLIDDPESWDETSGSAMFTFGMIRGVRDGWLDPKVYGPAAAKAWTALTTCLDEKANIRDVCVGTNKGDSHDYYIKRARALGDLHGQSPMLWCAAALLEPDRD